MNENQDFEASVKSGVTPDVDFIKSNDELVNGFLQENKKNSPVLFLLFLLAAVAFFFINKIIMVVCALFGVGALYFYIRKKKYVGGLKNESYLKEIYEEGLLSPGMIVKTEPLTVMAIADMRTSEDCENRYACRALRVRQLPGASGTLYEKIPCSCMFRYEEGDYHSAFEPHPLYWGTRDQEEIRAAIRQLEEEQQEDDVDAWEILKKISAEFPDLEPDQILLLDASFTPVGVKRYWEDNYQPVITEQVLDQYPKAYPEIPHITDDIPAAVAYNKMIDLAIRHQVYEYISVHCKEQDYAPLSNPGYFTYIGDPMTFLEAFDRRNITLAEGEYPLIAGLMLLTTRGCWKKKEFIPWKEFTLDAGISSLGEIETKVNGKCIVEFKLNTEYYVNHENFSKEDIDVVKKIETKRINGFLKELKETFDN